MHILISLTGLLTHWSVLRPMDSRGVAWEAAMDTFFLVLSLSILIDINFNWPCCCAHRGETTHLFQPHFKCRQCEGLTVIRFGWINTVELSFLSYLRTDRAIPFRKTKYFGLKEITVWHGWNISEMKNPWGMAKLAEKVGRK